MPGLQPTLDEWKAGTLHSGSKTGPLVTSQKQALAIGFSENKRKAKDTGLDPAPLAGLKAAQPSPF
jgi:hypothetical protein